MSIPLGNIKGYDLRDRIGAGGFGAVYRAYQTTVGREVAIKIILPGLANQPDFIRRFESEAQLVARLEHPHITPLYDYWRDPEGAYLVMRWLRGGSLRDALQKGPFDLRAVAGVIDQIAGALSLAHRNGVIHRDIKPGNILLDEDGNAYLTDFGIAKDLNLSSGSHTQPDAIIGSLDYISPEQARSEPVTPRTDIYSLGVTLYEMITGHHPFQNMSAVERLYKHINDPLPDITTLEAGVQAAVNRVIHKATAKDPDQRYPDALAFAADFREAVGIGRTSATLEELLTQREQDILRLIIEGRSNKEIAQDLTITLGTVKWYVNQIYSKMGVRSRVQAIVRARELNLIARDGDSDSAIQPVSTEAFQPENPYKGLRAFTAADHKDFFGREKLVEKLLRRMAETGEYSRFLAVVGPSGGGKSSVVKAGLIPAIWRGDLPGSEKWFVAEMLPGAQPLDELEIALIKIANQHAGSIREQLERDANGLLRVAQLILPEDGSDLLLAIDQFEETYTLSTDEAARQHFLDLLVAAVTAPRSRVRVVITLRADFYDRPLHDPHFGDLLRSRLETILPLSAEELELAIVRPAASVGVAFEPGLVTTIVADVKYQPGALPLLQYALTELFEARQGRLLSREAYQRIGGISGALARRAEELYTSLPPADAAAAQQMFLRLVTLGEGVEDTRRRVPHAELLAVSADPEQMEEVLDTFAAYRLLSFDNDPGTRASTVEVAHEAILREWERLCEWLNTSRSDIQMQQQIAGMAAEWKAARGDASFLARGSRLEQFKAWMTGTTLALTPDERAFLTASSAERDRQAAVEQERQAREARLERRSQTFLRGLVVVLALAVVIAAGLTSVALNNASEAQTARDNTQLALATSDANFRRAEQGRLYLQANEASDRGASGNIGMALAIRSLSLGYSAGADAALARASGQGVVLREFLGHVFDIYDISYSPDGSLIATSSEGGTRIYDAATGEETRFLPEDLIVQAIAFSPDGRLLVTGGESNVLRLYDTATWEELATFDAGSAVNYVYFTPDGTQIIADLPTEFQLWGVVSGQMEQRFTVSETDGPVHRQGLIFGAENHPRYLVSSLDKGVYIRDAETGENRCTLLDEVRWDGLLAKWSEKVPILLLASVDNVGPVYVWNYETCTPVLEFNAHTARLQSMDINTTMGTAVTVDADGMVYNWDLAIGSELMRHFKANTSIAISIAPDGKSVLIPSFNVVYDYDLTFPAQPQTVITDMFDRVNFPRFAPDGQSIYIGGFGNAGHYSLFGSTQNLILKYPQPLRVFDVSLDGRFLAAPIESEDDFAIYWIDAVTGETIRKFEGFTQIGNFTDISLDGKRVVSGSFDLTARIWDTQTGETLQVLTGHTGVVSSANFSPDGAKVVTSSSDGTVRIWDANTGETLHVVDLGAPIANVSFSPDGRLIAAADTDGFADLVDAISGEVLHRLVGHTETVWTARFSPDSRLVVSASWDGTARIWDAVTGELVRVLDNGTTAPIFYAEFSPDGKSIVTGSAQDDRVYIWQVDLEATIATLCQRPMADLTDEQRAQYGITDTLSVCMR
jgi:serine/threonine protein kinase/WD40 repeat protein